MKENNNNSYYLIWSVDNRGWVYVNSRNKFDTTRDIRNACIWKDLGNNTLRGEPWNVEDDIPFDKVQEQLGKCILFETTCDTLVSYIV